VTTRPFLSARTPIAFAHRGGGALWPENTLVAFRAAIELGFRYIETDVHLTKDGEIVVFHDHRLERTTNGTGFVRDHTLAELQRLDAAHRFTRDGKSFPWRGKQVLIPTLREALALDPGVRFNIELKERGSGLPAAFWKLIEREAATDRVLVAAFDDALVRELRKLSRGRVATSAGQREVVAFWLAVRAGMSSLLPVGYDALQVPVRQGGLTVVDARFLRAARAKGVAVHVWTVDDRSEMRRLIALGVDGIMTDRPDLLLDVLAVA
jgi:glycerophosphoryl diester phosphodiesterase